MGVADVGGAVFLVIQRPWQDGNAKKKRATLHSVARFLSLLARVYI